MTFYNLYYRNIKVVTSVLRIPLVSSSRLSMDAAMASSTWRGVPISEIIGSQSPWGAPEFPLVSPGHNHTVLYYIPSNGVIGDRPPRPQVGQEKWDSEHVRLPCSSKSLYPVEDSNGESHLRKRWHMIKEALQQPIMDSKQLAEAILSYNTKFKSVWKFRALHYLFNEHLDEDESQYFFTVTLPQIAKLALDLPKLIQAPIPLLKQHKNHSISLTQLQIASLLANAFFCTFPRRNSNKQASEYAAYPHINFSVLYECAPHDDIMAKLACLCHYFRRVCTKEPRGVATFSRRSVPPKHCPVWQNSDVSIAALPLHVDPDGKIEDAHGLIQLDFANKYLGGGVLGHGSVQEEIRFAICPELMISMLFTEVLRPNEALIMIGCERYSQYSGYGRTFRWTGNFEDSTPLDSAGRRRVAVLAIDALPYNGSSHQYRREMVTRELNKAWVGYSFFTCDQPTLQYPGVATGNWGCGAFGGAPELKSLIQLMAAAMARRPMAYYTFGDTDIRDEVINVYNLLARFNVTVGQLYKYICQFSTSDVSRQHLHSFLQQVLLDEQKKPNPPKKCSPRPERMDTYNSSLGEQNNTSAINQAIHDDSPDLFSQDEEEIQKQSTTDPKPDPPYRNNHSTPKNESSNKTVVCTNKADSTKKTMNSTNKMGTQTKRLFDELQKFDEDNGKLNLNASTQDCNATKCFDMPMSQDIFRSSDSDIEENKLNATSSNEKTSVENEMKEEEKMAENTSRLFEEMQKLDEQHGRLNLSAPHTSLLNDSKNIIINSDASMECHRPEVSPEVKKKIARKITDYFSKKST